MAAQAHGRIGPCLDGVAAEVVVAVDELTVETFGHHQLYGRGGGAGMAVEAIGLIVALRAGFGGGSTGQAVLLQIVTLVGEVGQRAQRKPREVDVARRAARLIIGLLVMVAGQAGPHRSRGGGGGAGLGQLEVTAGAVAFDLGEVVSVREADEALTGRPGIRLGGEMTGVATALLPPLGMAAQAGLLWRQQSLLAHGGGGGDARVTRLAGDLCRVVLQVREPNDLSLGERGAA